MTRRMAIAFVVLLAAVSADAQEPARELELGGGWFQSLDVEDLSPGLSGSSVDLAWTKWFGRRTGLASGVTVILNPRDSGVGDRVVRAFPVHGHLTWRWRWPAGGRSSVHFGLGGGVVVGRTTYPVFVWDEQIETTRPDGSTATDVWSGPWWHAELFFTRREVREGLDLRVGVRSTPLVWLMPLTIVPLTVQPVAMVVWGF